MHMSDGEPARGWGESWLSPHQTKGVGARDPDGQQGALLTT